MHYVPMVGPKRAALFARLGVTRLAHLITHLPHRWEYHAGHMKIDQTPFDTIATVRAEVAECRWIPPRGRGQGRFRVVVDDETGSMELVWFNARYMIDKVHPGMMIEVTAKVVDYRHNRQMVNPGWRVIEPDDDAADRDAYYRPIYPATEDLTSAQIERVVQRVLDAAVALIDDHFDPAFRDEHHFPVLAEAYRMLHAPADEDEVKAARRRLAYDELFMLQLGVALRRQYTRTQLKAPELRWSDAIDAHIRERFGFALTAAQDQVVREIADDLQQTVPMNRLLQGDVGTGKTVVALYAMLMAAASNKQAALMAPTELLAEQHYLSITDMLHDSSVKVALLTGSLSQAERDAVRSAIEAGEIDLVLGTQSIISESVQFADLAVVVVDEQHRFGVLQRATIRSKAGDEATEPHYLVMTATPIPRTLSLTIFGDLEVSVITSPPPGRGGIATRVVTAEESDEVYRYLAGRIADGEQAYIVLPAIDEGVTNLKAVRAHYEQLVETYFADLRVAMVHGQLKRTTRERIMHRFRSGQIDVLVATTVIEVGIDVPNASVMVVEQADRFGLAQLHQLRGRVGRGQRQSICVFIADPTTDEGTQRLSAIASTSDGFEIAEKDLLIRGMGDMLGSRQHGLPPMRVARIPDDMPLLQLARRDAHALAEADPALSDPAHALLRSRLWKQYGEALGLADVG